MERCRVFVFVWYLRGPCRRLDRGVRVVIDEVLTSVNDSKRTGQVEPVVLVGLFCEAG